MSSCASDDRKISTTSTITHSPSVSPESPRHTAAIHPSQKTASRTLLEAPPRQPYRRLGEGSSASIDSGVEHMSLQEATSLTKPSVPPFLNTPWDHPLHWTMPSPAILADVFPSPLASAILAASPERNTRCFCSIVLTIAQALLPPPNRKNLLRDTPTSLADCLSTLPHILQPKALKVFTLECERLASLYGPTQLEHRIVTRTNLQVRATRSENTYAQHCAASGTASDAKPRPRSVAIERPLWSLPPRRIFPAEVGGGGRAGALKMAMRIAMCMVEQRDCLGRGGSVWFLMRLVLVIGAFFFGRGTFLEGV